MHPHEACPTPDLIEEKDRELLDRLVATGSTPNHYVRGTMVVVSDTITDATTGRAVDPTAATGYTIDPAGAKATYPCTSVTPNQWQFNVNANKVGMWRYRIEVPTGMGTGAAEGYFYVDQSPF